MSTLLIPGVKQTPDGLALHGAGDSAPCAVMTGAGRESAKEETRVHVCLIHFAVQRKLTQYKATRLQMKIYNKYISPFIS